jgi:hypothetical protein
MPLLCLVKLVCNLVAFSRYALSTVNFPLPPVQSLTYSRTQAGQKLTLKKNPHMGSGNCAPTGQNIVTDQKSALLVVDIVFDRCAALTKRGALDDCYRL